MKLLFDFFPIILFFIAFNLFGIFVATAATMAASVAQISAFYIKNRRFEIVHLLTLAILLVLGGATLYLQNELFIKWKPTAVNWLLAVSFFFSQYIGEKPLIRRLMDNNVSLPDMIWKRLNMSWVSFFGLMGAVNIYVLYNFDTKTWVNFKLFGMLGLTLLFVVLQAMYLTRHIEEETTADL